MNTRPLAAALRARRARPVDRSGVREPVDIDPGALTVLVTRWLREQRHRDGRAVCWSCPVDAASLVGRIEQAFQAGAL